MAQLRDKETSELVFEGTPLEVSAMAQAVGVKDVIFDDVGWDFDDHSPEDAVPEEGIGQSYFNHDAVIDSASTEASGLHAVEHDSAKAKAKRIESKLRPDEAIVKQVKDRIKEARSRVG